MSLVEQVQIEVFPDHLLVVFPGQADDFTTRWQEAYVFGETLERAAADIVMRPLLVEPVAVELEAAKLGVRQYRGLVVLTFDHTDRIRLGYEAARIVARSIRRVAQDLDLRSRGVWIKYDQKGRKGRPTPFWDANRFAKTFRTGK